MKKRVITAIVGVLVILGVVLQGGFLLTAALFAAAVLGFAEYKKMWNQINVDIYFYPAILSLFIIIMSAGSHSFVKFSSFLLVVFLLMLFSVLRIRGDALPSLIYTVFGILYIGMGFGALRYLRDIHEWIYVPGLTLDGGIFFIMLAFVGTWASDTFAYFVGRKWGKRKMASHISPNKTIEGLFGGIGGTVFTSLVLSYEFHYSLSAGLVAGILIAIMAPMGDLFESYVKRYCDVKDSGHILPGHGGILDRFDSLLFVAPTLLVFVLLTQRMSS